MSNWWSATTKPPIDPATTKAECPNCKRLHERGPFLTWPRKGRPPFGAPADIECPCGLTLRFLVPVRISECKNGYGWKWEAVTDEPNRVDGRKVCPDCKMVGNKRRLACDCKKGDSS